MLFTAWVLELSSVFQRLSLSGEFDKLTLCVQLNLTPTLAGFFLKTTGRKIDFVGNGIAESTAYFFVIILARQCWSKQVHHEILKIFSLGSKNVQEFNDNNPYII